MQNALAIAAMLLSVMSVLVAGWFSARMVRLSHELRPIEGSTASTA
jgi:hypothetical protein